MGGQKIKDAKHAAKIFIGYLDLLTRDQAGLVTFAQNANLDQSLTHDQGSIEEAIDNITVENGTNIAAGIITAYKELTGSRHDPAATQVMIVLSDGQSRVGISPLEAAERAKGHGIRIITIGLGDNAGHRLLRELASSPDDYYFAPSSSELEAVYTNIAGNITQCQGRRESMATPHEYTWA
jgi:Mg-chelatase subunit ChlD